MLQWNELNHRDRAYQIEHYSMIPVCPFPPMVQWDGIRCALGCLPNVCFLLAQDSVGWYSGILKSQWTSFSNVGQHLNGGTWKPWEKVFIKPLLTWVMTKIVILQWPHNEREFDECTNSESSTFFCNKRLGTRLASTCFQFQRKQMTKHGIHVIHACTYSLVLYRCKRYIAFGCCGHGYLVTQSWNLLSSASRTHTLVIG